jgi:hypothetical protein
MRELQRYWPERPAGTSIINADADVIQEPAVVLATHHRITLLKQSVDLVAGEKSRGVEISEEEFLEYFLQDCDNDNMLAPITGKSGCGKSHFIVWLEARLLRREDAHLRHIIRIPKGASFRSVIRLILSDLKGDSYAELHERVTRAGNDLTTRAAREWVVAGINIALDVIHTDLEGKLEQLRSVQRTDEVIARIKDLLQRLRQAKGLQALLSDNLFKHNHFFAEGNAIDRVAVRIVHGKKRSADPTKFQVTAEDLVLSQELERKVDGSAGEPARAYYAKLMGETQRKCHERAVAALVMNQAIDLAIPRLLQLGDNELNEVLRAIREQLEKEGRELVFLAEDFSVLAGIQGTLLDAMTVPRRGAGNPMCVMRTALAVTDGYISERDTIATRARFQFRMPEKVVDQQTIIDFVAEYLNAERYGTVALNAWYRDQGTDVSAPQLPPLDIPDLDREVLDAFGYSTRKIPLFPLNCAAIREILKLKLHEVRGGLVFHPRTIVNHVLIQVFKNHARTFMNDKFPPSNFALYRERTLESMAPQLTPKIKGLAPPDFDGRRWLVLLRFWGGAPTKIADALKLDARLYEAFGLPVLPGADTDVQSPKASDLRPGQTGGGVEPPPQPPLSPPPPSPPPLDDPIVEWDADLTEWYNGTQLPTARANLIRRWILDLVLRHIDWHAEGLRQPMASLGEQKKVWLGDVAAGGLAKGTCHILVGGLEDGAAEADRQALHLALRGIIRFELGGWQFDFEDADMLYGQLMAHLPTWSAQFLDWYRRECADLVAAEVYMLAALAAVERGSAMTPDEAGELFVRERSDVGGDPAWRELHSALGRERTARIDLLLALVGIVQGGHVDAREAQQQLAIDGWHLARAIDGIDPGAMPSVAGLSTSKRYQKDTALVAKAVAERWMDAVAAQRTWLMVQSEAVAAAIPAGTNTNQLLDKLKDLLDIAQDRGLEYSLRRNLRHTIEEVEGTDLQGLRDRLVDLAGRASEANPHQLAQASTLAVVRLANLASTATALLDAAESKLNGPMGIGDTTATVYRREVDGFLGAFIDWKAPDIVEAS